MLKLFDIVTLKNDDPETGVKAGTEGTIVDVLGNGKAFTVEFFDEDENTIHILMFISTKISMKSFSICLKKNRMLVKKK